jgi:hypothetical protein
MKRNLIFLFTLIALYLVPSLIFDAVYGPSYMLWETNDYWRPDAAGGWEAVGHPAEPMPEKPSRVVSIWEFYLPFLLPGLVLMLVLLTPLTRLLEDPRPKSVSSDPEAGPPDAGTLPASTESADPKE